MKISSLEKSVLQWMLEDPAVPPLLGQPNPEDLIVTEREVSGVGGFTEFAATAAARLFDQQVSLRWGGNLVGRLNKAIDVGFVVYVDNGVVSSIEGFTYGGEHWPSSIKSYELRGVTPTGLDSTGDTL